MVKVFEKNMGLQVTLIVVALGLLWCRALIAPPAMMAGDKSAILYDLVYRGLGPMPRLATILAMTLVLVEGVMLNLLLSNVGVVSQKSLLPTLLYIIAMSASAKTLTPMLLVNAALIPCLNQLLLRGSLLTIPTNKICGATMLIGLATMFYFPAWTLVISYLLIAVNYRLYGWKDWCVMILGLIGPYLLLGTVLMMTGDLADAWMAIVEKFNDFAIRIDTVDMLRTCASLFLMLLFVVSLVSLWSKLGERTIIWQKNASTVMLLTVGGICMMFYAQLVPVDMQMVGVPFALVANHFLAPDKRRYYGRGKKNHDWIFDILLILTLVAALIC